MIPSTPITSEASTTASTIPPTIFITP